MAWASKTVVASAAKVDLEGSVRKIKYANARDRAPDIPRNRGFMVVIIVVEAGEYKVVRWYGWHR